MKNALKNIAALCMMLLSLVSANAADFALSAGGGITGGGSWKNATLKDQYKNYQGYKPYGDLFGVPDETTENAMKQGLFNTKESDGIFGIFAFLDATYAEFDVSLLWTPVSQTVDIPNLPKVSGTLRGSETYEYLFTQMYFSLLLKYPFHMNDHLTLFPLVGAAYQVALADRDDKLYESFKKVKALGYDVPNLGEYWNAFWLKFGAGADYALTRKLYLRCNALYTLKMPNEFENDRDQYWTEDFKGMAQGFNISLGVGYKFKTF